MLRIPCMKSQAAPPDHRLRHVNRARVWLSCTRSGHGRMIDNFSLGLTHGLMLLAAFLLMRRPDLDSEAPPGEQAKPRKRRWGRP